MFDRCKLVWSSSPISPLADKAISPTEGPFWSSCISVPQSLVYWGTTEDGAALIASRTLLSVQSFQSPHANASFSSTPTKSACAKTSDQCHGFPKNISHAPPPVYEILSA